jgi:hypothetical protein
MKYKNAYTIYYYNSIYEFNSFESILAPNLQAALEIFSKEFPDCIVLTHRPS